MSKETKKNEDTITKDCEKHEECNCGCEHDDMNTECDCGCADYDFAPVHNSFSCANIIAVTFKVAALITFILSVYSITINFSLIFNQIQSVNDMVLYIISSALTLPGLLLAVGEIINLLNRIKEAIYN